jgi:lipopolysaccharide transport system permease protein
VVVFSIFFGRLGKIPSDGIPYPIFSFTGLVPWTLFVYGLAQSSNSLVGSQNLIKKVYFPRLTIPIASLFAGIVDFLIALAILVIMMVYYAVTPSMNMVWLPFFFLLTLVTSLGVGFWLSALNVEYRDVRFAVPFLTQFWMYATPIAYPSSMLPEPWRTLYGLNPMAGVVEGFRWSLLGSHTQPGPIILASSGVAVIMMVSGAYYFKRMERNFADVV